MRCERPQQRRLTRGETRAALRTVQAEQAPAGPGGHQGGAQLVAETVGAHGLAITTGQHPIALGGLVEPADRTARAGESAELIDVVDPELGVDECCTRLARHVAPERARVEQARGVDGGEKGSFERDGSGQPIEEPFAELRRSGARAHQRATPSIKVRESATQ